MITRQELCSYLSNFLQTSLFNDACFNGLQVEGKENISTVVTAVSASLDVIQQAVDTKADALIVHHGLFWNRDSYEITGVKREKLALLLKHDISLLAYHLPLDAHVEVGNNWKAARDLGWQNLQPFGVYNGQPIGVRGSFDAKSRDALQKELETYYRHPAHVALGGKKLVTEAALISGGAYRSLGEAASAGIDCFITGNFDEPAWNQAFEEKTNFFALGHSATETVGPKALGEHLQEVFGLSVRFLDVPNPF